MQILSPLWDSLRWWHLWTQKEVQLCNPTAAQAVLETLREWEVNHFL